MHRRAVVAVLAALALAAGAVGVNLFRQTPLIAGVDQYRVDETLLAEFSAGIDRCAAGPAEMAWDCANRLVIEGAPRLGVATTMAGLRAAVDERPELFEQNCHRNVHYLGEYAGEAFGDVDAALAAGGPDCQFGYYHGVIEGYARVTPTLWEEIDGLCAKISDDPASYVWAECSHSLGHAVVTRTDDRIGEGLERCRLLSRDSDVSACATGIFMSWSNHLDALLREPGTTQDDLDPKYQYPPAAERWTMCPDLDDLLAGACVLFFAETTVHDAEHLGAFRAWCDGMFGDRALVRRQCHAGVGRVLGGYEEFRNIGRWPGVVAFCTSGGYPDDLIAECAKASYVTASGFLLDPAMVAEACAAWDGHRLRDEQCAAVEEMFAATVADAGPLDDQAGS